MPNMDPKKVAMPVQDAKQRAANWSEVALGYTEEMAKQEADRCLQCKNRPCMAGCPVQVDIPGFIKCIKDGDYKAAYDTIAKTNSLPAVCGRVCPQENQCEKLCVRGIKGEPVGIGRLERFAAEFASPGKVESDELAGRRVAVVGSGPAGLTCAGDLAASRCDVTIFEAFHTAGGVLMYGIPEFRLPKAVVQQEIDAIVQKGVKIELNSVVGRLFSVDDLFEDGFEAVFISTGAGLPNFMNIEGEGAVGVFSANEYLTRINLMKAYDSRYATPIRRSGKVAVIGGGNVAMDAARCAKRLGADEVTIVYRRSKNEMPARLEEVEHAEEEGILFRTLTNPTRILSDENGQVTGIECIEMQLGEPDERGRPRPIEKPGSEFVIELDTVIIAIGTSPNPLVSKTTGGIELNKRGCIVADDNMRTTRDGVWAGGDTVTGAATVILAMGAGKTAAADIKRYLLEK